MVTAPAHLTLATIRNRRPKQNTSDIAGDIQKNAVYIVMHHNNYYKQASLSLPLYSMTHQYIQYIV